MRGRNLKRAEPARGESTPKIELVASMDATSPEDMRARSIAIELMFAALFCFACLDTSGKWMSRHIPIWEVVWARYLGAPCCVLRRHVRRTHPAPGAGALLGHSAGLAALAVGGPDRRLRRARPLVFDPRASSCAGRVARPVRLYADRLDDHLRLHRLRRS